MLEKLLNWFESNQENLIHWGYELFVAIAIFIVGRAVVKVVKSGVEKFMKSRGVDDAASSFVSRVLYLLLMAGVLLASLDHLGVQTSSLIAMLGAAGLAVGLAVKDSLSNFASGVLLILLKPFKLGDFVETNGLMGTATKIELFATTLTTPDNREIVLPNSMLFSNTIVNYSANDVRRIDLVIGVSYSADLKQTREVLARVCEQHPEVIDERGTFIGVKALADSSVNFDVRPWVASADFLRIQAELKEAIKIALDDAKIEIPFPQMDVHLQKES